MKPMIVGLLLLIQSVNTQAQKVFVKDNNASARKVTESFNAIKISGGIDLYLSQFREESIAVSASEEKYKEGIITEVVNNTLKIYYKGPNSWMGGNKKLKVYLSFKNLQKLEASGACGVQVAGNIDVPSLMLDLSGASSFKGALKVQALELDLSGASNVTLSGSANKVAIESSGASDVNAYNLTTELCTATASGASDIHITVNGALSANASGASDISYKGSGVLKDQRSTGASSINKKN